MIMVAITLKSIGAVVLKDRKHGHSVIPMGTALRHLNFFDGMFLRAEHLKTEQEGLRNLAHISNQAGGHGVVYGYDTALSNGSLRVGGGLAIDVEGRVVYLPDATDIGIEALITSSASAPGKRDSADDGAVFGECRPSRGDAPGAVIDGVRYYVITVGHIEGLCGSEDVFGKLCEEACVTSSARPYLLEGVLVRAEPVPAGMQLPASTEVALTGRHLRSRIASAYFAYESELIGDLISADGLAKNGWCHGASLPGGITSGVPIALLARSGSQTLFLDRWVVARERMEAPPKRYWASIMAMRPWNVFLAQVLQFQCQLHNLFSDGKPVPMDDPCDDSRAVLRETSIQVKTILAAYRKTAERLAADASAGQLDPVLKGLEQVESKLKSGGIKLTVPSRRLLIDGGIVELPSAGYLPIQPESESSVNEQVRRMLGEGVDLRFCVVRPDYVPHALEEAQHMQRISLLQGLDNPGAKPKVDVLVPGGGIVERKLVAEGLGFEAALDVSPALLNGSRDQPGSSIEQPMIRFQGAARAERLPSGGGAVYLGGEYQVRPTTAEGGVRTAPEIDSVVRNVNTGEGSMFGREAFAAIVVRNIVAGSWISLSCERNVFALKRGDTSSFNGRAIVAASSSPDIPLLDLELAGMIEIADEASKTGGNRSLKGRIENARFSYSGRAFDNPGPRKTILVALQAEVMMTGSSAVDIVLTYQNDQFKLSANWEDEPLRVSASVSSVARDRDSFSYSEAGLQENAAVLSADHTDHLRALVALDVIAAALRDVNFAAAKARLLFPTPKSPVDEIEVRAKYDWVLFHRRREKQCGEVADKPPLKAPQSYRVYNVTAPNLGRAEVIAERMAEPEALAAFVAEQANAAPNVVVKFAGDSAQPLFEFPVVENQWRLFKPEALIAFVIYGAKDNDNDVLQTNRLRQLESAIEEESREFEQTKLKPLVPFPVEAEPANADGIMLFVTIPELNLRNALLVHGNWDRVGGQGQHFLNEESPLGTTEFRDNVPQGDGLKNFIAALTPRQLVRGVTLATAKAEPDAEAQQRLNAVIEALAAADRPLPGATRQVVEALNEHDRKELQKIGQEPEAFDEIIFFELNAGA